MCRGLKTFYEKFNALPLSSNIPDMEVNYIFIFTILKIKLYFILLF